MEGWMEGGREGRGKEEGNMKMNEIRYFYNTQLINA